MHDERTTYSQRGVFRLEAYHLTQSGPSFPGADVAFDRKSWPLPGEDAREGRRARGDGERRVRDAAGSRQRPDAPLAQEHAARGTGHRPAGGVHAEAALSRMELHQEGEDRIVFAGDPKQAARHLVDLEIGGVTGVVASVIGKNPPDLRYWLALGDIPAFVRFQGAMFLERPGVARGDGRGRLGSRHALAKAKLRGQAQTLAFEIRS